MYSKLDMFEKNGDEGFPFPMNSDHTFFGNSIFGHTVGGIGPCNLSGNY